MRVGITCDLKSQYEKLGYRSEDLAEFDSDATISAIADCLVGLGHEVSVIGHIRNLVDALHQGQRWDLVFNLCEGMHGFGREAQVPALLDAFGIPYTFSDPLAMALTLHKGMTKRILASDGVPTARFALVSSERDLAELALEYPLFVKPVAEGSSIGIRADSVVADAAGLRDRCASLLAAHGQPVLVEELLPGEEFTVGIVGTGAGARALGVAQIRVHDEAEAGVYTCHLKRVANWQSAMAVTPAAADMARVCSRLALRAWGLLGCRDAGRVDIRCDRCGMPNVMEVNVLPGLAPGYSDLALIAAMAQVSYHDLIAMIVDSARERLAERPHAGVAQLS